MALWAGTGEGGKEGATEGEGGIKVEISNSGISQQTWLANPDYHLRVSEPWASCLSSLGFLCKMGIITEPSSLDCFED